jgi:hypothetical protein
VRAFPAGQGDTANFLRLLQPAAVVVDNAEEAEAAAEFAREARATVVHVSLREDRLRLLHAVGGRTCRTARRRRSGSAAQL